MRSLVFLLTVCGALADTKLTVDAPVVALDTKLKANDAEFITNNRRGQLFSTLFNEGYTIRDAETLFAVSPQKREDSGLPEIIPGIPTEVLIVAVIAKIILIIIVSTQLSNEGMNNLSTVPVVEGGIDETVNNVLGNNPNLLNTLAMTVLPSLLPLLISEGREQIDTDLIMDKTDATAFARMDGVQGELYFAQIKPNQSGKEGATVIAGALQGFKPLTSYKVSIHKSGDTTDACSNVGELYAGTKEHQFKTDTEGRSVLLLHESGLTIRGKDGIMGRSVVITDNEVAQPRNCGIVINA